MTFEQWLETQMDTAPDPCEKLIAIESVAIKLFKAKEKEIHMCKSEFIISFYNYCEKEGLLDD